MNDQKIYEKMFTVFYPEGNVNKKDYDITFKLSVANVYTQTMFF